jgi:hypothetical protein
MTAPEKYDNRTRAGRDAIDRAVLRGLAPKQGRTRGEVWGRAHAILPGVTPRDVSASLARHVRDGKATCAGKLRWTRYWRVTR